MFGKTRRYRDDVITVTETGEDIDFIGYIENHTDEDVELTFIDEIESIIVPAGDWLGLLADKVGYAVLEAIMAKRFQEVCNG